MRDLKHPFRFTIKQNVARTFEMFIYDNDFDATAFFYLLFLVY